MSLGEAAAAVCCYSAAAAAASAAAAAAAGAATGAAAVACPCSPQAHAPAARWALPKRGLAGSLGTPADGYAPAPTPAAAARAGAAALRTRHRSPSKCRKHPRMSQSRLRDRITVQICRLGVGRGQQVWQQQRHGRVSHRCGTLRERRTLLRLLALLSARKEQQCSFELCPPPGGKWHSSAHPLPCSARFHHSIRPGCSNRNQSGDTENSSPTLSGQSMILCRGCFFRGLFAEVGAMNSGARGIRLPVRASEFEQGGLFEVIYGRSGRLEQAGLRLAGISEGGRTGPKAAKS